MSRSSSSSPVINNYYYHDSQKYDFNSDKCNKLIEMEKCITIIGSNAINTKNINDEIDIKNYADKPYIANKFESSGCALISSRN